jgi:hypothetical protein
MVKNGNFFISIVERNKGNSSVWDPFSYRTRKYDKRLSNYVKAVKLVKSNTPKSNSPFDPIEYRHIPKGHYLSFTLNARGQSSIVKLPEVGEQVILFGTMRAYLANVLVTPKASWVNFESPIYFPVKSEFLLILPEDEYHYFWWAYLRSPDFISNIPIGSGGTRPRLRLEKLIETPVRIPDIDIRKGLHERLIECAKVEWENYVKAKDIVNVLGQ